MSGERCVRPPDSLAVVGTAPQWVERYGPRSEESHSPVGGAGRVACAEEIGEQGRELLDALYDPMAPQWLRHTGFDVSHFPIDWEHQQATCPQRCTSTSWTPTIDNRKAR
ncbi:hypothetical protein [Ktedonospora formicarum]|uniref:hypothetical protein n=1 Tax=Ktedonospora formicarum TaxID=2778364 RepID=UPI001C68C773|nr:hypothetical protein [Ktedonospora formicarum]